MATRFGYVTTRGDKWIKGTIISKVGTVMYKAKCCNEIYEKYIDQLRFCPDIETELEVKDTSHSEQNLSLHPIPHIIEPNQSNQTTTSPSSDKSLSDNHQYVIISISWQSSTYWTKHRHVITAVRHKSAYYEG